MERDRDRDRNGSRKCENGDERQEDDRLVTKIVSAIPSALAPAHGTSVGKPRRERPDSSNQCIDARRREDGRSDQDEPACTTTANLSVEYPPGERKEGEHRSRGCGKEPDPEGHTDPWISRMLPLSLAAIPSRPSRRRLHDHGATRPLPLKAA
jgi:hypothetical protein